jgi:hypothetical protein
MAITALAVAAVLIMGVLTVAALNARREAERQRAKAETLVEFMLTDLRHRLKGVGRLDVMAAVNENALRYYKDENLASLPVDSLERRARILHAMGEDDEDRGDHKDAMLKFREAERTTAELLKDAPNDPERVFDHAQSVYGIGEVDYEQGRLAGAAARFREYRTLATRMIALSPENTKYRLELAYADSNLCSFALDPKSSHAGAIQICAAALADIKIAASHPDANYDNPEAQKDLATQILNSMANLADAYRVNHNFAASRSERKAEEHLLDRELATDPKNKDLQDTWIVIQRAYAHLDEDQGRPADAEATLEQAIAAANQMVGFDPTNAQWAQLRADLLRQLAKDRQRQQNLFRPQNH